MAGVVEFIKKEFSGWGKHESIIFPCVILLIVIISIFMNDKPVALVAAICGICSTILAGKGRISCYLFGMVTNLCYSYISLKNMFWGHLVLNMLYYFPMQFVGIAKWRKHFKKDRQEICKTALTQKERISYSLIALISSIAGYFLLKNLGDLSPMIDATTTVLSIIAFVLTVRRCIEQWYVWTIVNTLNVIMWIIAFLHGSHSFALVLMWFTYLLLGLYFLREWKKELQC